MVPKEELRERLWPAVIVQEANMKNLVGEIRAAIGYPGVIRTAQRFGYAFGHGTQSVETNVIAGRLIDRDRIYPLKSGANIIGRDEVCAIVLDGGGVSRQHARITAAEGGYILEDLGSKNGTWRNEECVRAPVALSDGDRIRLGDYAVTFRSRRSPATTHTARPSHRDAPPRRAR